MGVLTSPTTWRESLTIINRRLRRLEQRQTIVFVDTWQLTIDTDGNLVAINPVTSVATVLATL